MCALFYQINIRFGKKKKVEDDMMSEAEFLKKFPITSRERRLLVSPNISLMSCTRSRESVLFSRESLLEM